MALDLLTKRLLTIQRHIGWTVIVEPSRYTRQGDAFTISGPRAKVIDAQDRMHPDHADCPICHAEMETA